MFTGDMVTVILNRKKTQTRRPVKPQYAVGEKWFKPKYQKGQIIWGRETWQKSECFDWHIKDQFVYRANVDHEEFAKEHKINWKPSIHMPRKAARIFLKVTNVIIERIQDITKGDCIREGCITDNPLIEFQDIWDQIYYTRGSGWKSNPYVYEIDFELLEDYK